MIIDRMKPKKTYEAYKIPVSLILLPDSFFLLCIDFISLHNPSKVHSLKG